MGSPTKSQIEAFTDLIAAKMQAELTGCSNEYAAMTVSPLWEQVDASGDAAVEIALAASALAIDEQSLPVNHRTILQNVICQRAGYRNWVNALDTHVRSAA